MRITAFSVSGAGASGAMRLNIGTWCDYRCTASSGSILGAMQAVKLAALKQPLPARIPPGLPN